MKEKYLYQPISKNKDAISVWLGFPYTYMYGMSTLGYLTLYKELDTNENAVVERIFQDTKTTGMKRKKIDLFGFSCIFDNDVFSILKIFERFKVPFLSKDRTKGPLIFAGGPVMTANPESYADIFDFIIIGDGENVLSKVVSAIKKLGPVSRQEKLKAISRIKGVYVPSLYSVSYKDDFSILSYEQKDKMEKNYVQKNTSELVECIYSPIVASKSFYSDAAFIEMGRGCSHKCKFCTASFYNFPTRYPSFASIKAAIDKSLKAAKKLVFIGAMIADHPDFDAICDYLYNLRVSKEFQIEFSSLRADNYNEKAAKVLRLCGSEDVSIAIEAASQKMRDDVNKKLTESQLKGTIADYVKKGFKKINVYFMIGLPGESQHDMDEFVRLATLLKQENPSVRINYIISSFIPKPNTPYQRKPRESTEVLKSKQIFLKENLSKIGSDFSFTNLHQDYMSAVLSRGDRRLTDFILHVYKKKITPKNWSESHKRFLKCSEQKLPDTDWYAIRQFGEDEILPWDFIQFVESDKNLEQELLHN